MAPRAAGIKQEVPCARNQSSVLCGRRDRLLSPLPSKGMTHMCSHAHAYDTASQSDATNGKSLKAIGLAVRIYLHFCISAVEKMLPNCLRLDRSNKNSLFAKAVVVPCATCMCLKPYRLSVTNIWYVFWNQHVLRIQLFHILYTCIHIPCTFRLRSSTHHIA